MDSLFPSDRAQQVRSHQKPDEEMVRFLAEELRAYGFKIVDVKQYALLVEAGKRNLMIGIRSCE